LIIDGDITTVDTVEETSGWGAQCPLTYLIPAPDIKHTQQRPAYQSLCCFFVVVYSRDLWVQ